MGGTRRDWRRPLRRRRQGAPGTEGRPRKQGWGSRRRFGPAVTRDRGCHPVAPLRL